MTIYYLDNSAPGASDSNAGISAAQPLKTLAALNNFRPGDTIEIKAGTSYTGTLAINSSGTATAPITFTKYGTGADPVISTTGQYGINMVGANFVVVNGIDISAAARAGVEMDANSAHDTLENMNVSNVGFGYEIVGAHDNLFTGNYVHDLNMVVNTTATNTDYGAIAFGISGNNNEFSFNKVVNAQAVSSNYGLDGGGFEFWRSVSNVSIHDNIVENSNGFFEAGGMGAGDVVSGIQIYNNVSANNGLFEWLHNNTSVIFGETINGLNIHNNTIYEPTAGLILGSNAPVTNNGYTFTNNLVYAPKAEVSDQPGSFGSNDFYQAGVAPSGTGETTGTINFVNPAAGNFAVMAGTAAAAYGAYTGGQTPGLPITPVTSGTLDVGVSEDAYLGDAQFTIIVDGQQLGGTMTTHTLHSTGASEHFMLTGTFGAGEHDVKISFLNDAYGGTASTDRNLYVASVSLNGTSYANTSAALFSTGSTDLFVGGSLPVSTVVPDKLVLHLSEDAYLGNAQFSVSIDGKTLDTPETITALHASGSIQDFTYTGQFGAGTHDIGVTFLNDAYAGTPSTDRNMYVNSLSFDSHTYAGASLMSNGTTHFTVSA